MIAQGQKITPEEEAQIKMVFSALAVIVHHAPLRVGWAATQRIFACVVASALDDRSEIEPTCTMLSSDMRVTIEAFWDDVKGLQAAEQLAAMPPAAGRA